MAHEIYWMKPERVLYVSYQGDQNADTLKETLDAMAEALDTVTHPVVVLINGLEITSMEQNAIRKMAGHRAYSHPMAARGVLVGFDPVESFNNEVTAVKSRGDKNTIYFKTLDEAKSYLSEMLKD